MRYFVVGDDGQKYGPADVDTLNDWIGQQRLMATQQLEEEMSGVRMAAAAVKGLTFPLQSAATQPAASEVPAAGLAPGSIYGSTHQRMSFADDGNGDVQAAWIYAVLGLVIPFLHIGTFQRAMKAAIKGNEGAAAPRLFSAVVLTLQVIGIGYGVFLFIMAHRK